MLESHRWIPSEQQRRDRRHVLRSARLFFGALAIARAGFASAQIGLNASSVKKRFVG